MAFADGYGRMYPVVMMTRMISLICVVTLMRMSSPGGENDFEIRTRLFPFQFLSKNVAPSLNARGLTFAFFFSDTATFCVGVRAVGDASFEKRKALLVPQESLVFFAVLNNGVTYFKFVGRNSVNLPLLTSSSIWEVYPSPNAAFSFGSHLDMDDHPSGHIVSGLDVTCVLVNLRSTE